MTERVDPKALLIGRPVREDGLQQMPIGPDLADGATAAEGETKRRPVKKILIGVVMVAVAGLGVNHGWTYWTVGRFQESTDDAYIKADSTIIAPKISGQLTSVLIGDNESVRAGQTLAQIDDRDFRSALKQAHANAIAAGSSAEIARASIEQQRAVVEQARATLALDQANLLFARQENERYATLATRGAGSVQNAQQAQSRLDVSKATLQRDEATVTAAERQIDMLNAQLAHAQAVLLHDEAVEDQARLNLSYTKIVAPIDGVVGNRTLRVGQYVQAGTALMGVVPLAAVYVVANFKETQLTHVRKGQKVEIEVDSFPGQMVGGAVDTLAPSTGQEFALLPPDNATGNFTKIVQRVPVRIAIDSEDPMVGRLRPGMSVVPTIDIKGGAKP